MKNPKRGEVWRVDLGLAAKTRPCLVASIALEDQDRSLVAVVPRTTQVQGTRFEVAIKVPFLQPGVFDVQNLISIPRAKFLRKLGVLTQEQMGFVESSLRFWLDL